MGKRSRSMKVAGLFSGIGGLEQGFVEQGYEPIFMCEIDSTSRDLLRRHFPGTRIANDIHGVSGLPKCDVAVAGFPCQPYSQAGPMHGLLQGRTLLDEMFRVLHDSRTLPTYVVLENVQNILHLNDGEALRKITRELEALDYQWAYRLVDTNAFGVPQRRRRWICVASLNGDACDILFGETPPVVHAVSAANSVAHGFYWTEGNTGLGWADDAIPPLKSGSALGIPSPPAIWVKDRRSIAKPHIRDAERLQGLAPGWTDLGHTPSVRAHERSRWRMIGNAVSVPTSSWIASRILDERVQEFSLPGKAFLKRDIWPKSAWGGRGYRYAAQFGKFEPRAPLVPILDFLWEDAQPLSERATKGFRTRLEMSTLRYPNQFLSDLRYHERRQFPTTLLRDA